MSGTKQDYINYRVQKSDEIFEDAKLLAQNLRWNSCVNRLYYSTFYLTSALLYKNDINAETHNGTKKQFNLHFVKTGKIELELGKLFSSLFDWRHETDYTDFVDFDKETVQPLIEQVENFNKKLKALITQ
jgi:uncharacterized protein (UPF0332 family)